MDIKRKTMRRDEWPKSKSKKIKIEDTIINNKHARICLIRWDDIDNLSVNGIKGPLTIADKNYKWLEIALEGDKYFITSMYDDNDNFIEIYFDINSGNYFEGDNVYFFDMFTDIIISNDGTITLLDAEELEETYKSNNITFEEYERTKKVTLELLEYINHNKDKILEYCYNKMIELKQKL